MKYLFYLFLLLIINHVINTSQTFLSKEINGIFTNNYRMSIGINFKDSRGFLFYAIDSEGNELSIKLGDLFYLKPEFIYSFNGKTFTRKNGLYSTYSTNQFSTLLKFEKFNLYHDYDNQLIMFDAFQRSEEFNQHSLLKHHKIGINKTLLIIGHNPSNISLNTSYSNDFVGCLDFLYINYEKVLLQSNGNEDVSSSCWNDLTHRLCTTKECQNFTLSENLLDCTFSATNVKKYCNRDLSNYENQTKSFERIGDKNQSTGIKFVWKLENDQNYCLLEIIPTNKLVLLFYINNDNQVVFYNQKDNATKILIEKVTFRNLIHILIIKFDYPNIFIKASYGKIVNSFIYKHESNVTQVNIGFSSYFNKCQTFKGKTAFRYDFSEFRPIFITKLELGLENASNSKKESLNISIDYKNLVYLIFTTISVIMNIILICVIIHFIKRKENGEFPSVKSLNIYETVNFENTPLPNQTRNDIRVSAEYDYIT